MDVKLAFRVDFMGFTIFYQFWTAQNAKKCNNFDDFSSKMAKKNHHFFHVFTNMYSIKKHIFQKNLNLIFFADFLFSSFFVISDELPKTTQKVKI